MGDYLKKGADISNCGRYRYHLYREWDKDLPVCVFVGLNPSTADADNDDPTIRRCVAFAKRFGCGSLYMLNLFAFRATDPKEMKQASDPVGPLNDASVMRICGSDDVKHIIAAWGAHGGHLNRNGKAKFPYGVKIECLGKTKAGHPKHPLYLKANTPLETFSAKGEPQ